MTNEGKFAIYSIYIHKCNKKIRKVGEIFGFGVSHPTLNPITKPTLPKIDAQWTGIRGVKFVSS